MENESKKLHNVNDHYKQTILTHYLVYKYYIKYCYRQHITVHQTTNYNSNIDTIIVEYKRNCGNALCFLSKLYSDIVP